MIKYFSFFIENNLIADNQSGFRADHDMSCERPAGDSCINQPMTFIDLLLIILKSDLFF